MIKALVKSLLAYKPLPATDAVRGLLARVRVPGQPFTPDDEGDLLFDIIRKNGFAHCLEVGFYTGSTALFMAAAIAEDGHVTSMSIDDEATVAAGLALVAEAGFTDKHTYIAGDSTRVLPAMRADGKAFDFVYMDGWKTLDHLTLEVFLVNEMLKTGGVIVFDDANMPSVRNVIRLMKRYYGYEEIRYADYNQDGRLRLFKVLTTRSLHRPYRALTKRVATQDQPAKTDYAFY